MVAAQRLKKPRGIPRPFYRFGEPMNVDFPLTGTAHDQAAGADCTTPGAFHLYLGSGPIIPVVRLMYQIFDIPE